MSTQDQDSKIVILGANSKVGVELCMYLDLLKNISLVAIVRTEYAATLLKKLGITYLSGDISQNSMIQRAISNADLVLDLAAPSKMMIDEMRSFYKRRLEKIFQYMSSDSVFVFASTQAAFGYKEPMYPRLKYYFFPRSVYAANKRYAENICTKLGKRSGIDVFLLRLGDVHGVMQNPSILLKDLIRQGYSFTVSDNPANTVFVCEIAQALVNITKKMELPGLYTMVSYYFWSWRELLLYMASCENMDVKINLVSISERKIGSYFSFLKKSIFNFLVTRRDLLMANFSFLSSYMPIMKNRMLSKRVETEVQKIKLNPEYTDLGRFIGVLPGKRMESLLDVKNTIGDYEREIQKKLSSLLE